MPFIVNTPESLLDRSDSKNPSTTCRGITASGRPCRRPVASSANATPPVARFRTAQLRVDDPRDATLYCWQHKDQASLSAHSSPGPRMSSTPILEERSSLDTLADRLGLVAQLSQSEKTKRHKQQKLTEKPGPPQRPTKMARPKPAKTVEFCCCFRIPIEEVPPPPSRPKPRPLQSPASAPLPPRLSGRKASDDNAQQQSAAETARYMSLIPADASPQVASLLMSELAKPVSRLDEPGYIYMFWLTPESRSAQTPVDAARSLLFPPLPVTPTRPGGQRRPSDVLASFAAADNDRASRGSSTVSGSGSTGNKKIMLKIGRATNVQRRLNEWTRQCGYDLSLIRYYPYISSTSPAAVPRKLPHSHKVERLIHIELAGLGLRVPERDQCVACGREHREWFEVDATRKGVADVDKIIRKWVDWDESLG
ncbi:meiotically up-regulated gene 113-domain-containing protein [Coniochaeta sp. 2T2.1]|nr:meiotically up-regulated gene 113-domain-containing protein [Coniochaeta sp. 2T2.1]